MASAFDTTTAADGVQKLRPRQNSDSERHRARRTCAAYALRVDEPHQVLTDLLAQLGLSPTDEPR